MLPAYLFPDPDQELRMASRELSPDSASIAPGYATCSVLLAKSRPEVVGTAAAPFSRLLDGRRIGSLLGSRIRDRAGDEAFGEIGERQLGTGL